MSVSNGEKEAMDEQQRRQIEANGVQHAMQQLDDEKSEYVKSILESEMALIAQCGLENFLSNDFVLANYDKRDIAVIRWRTWIVWEKILADHPKEGDLFTGDREMEMFYGINPATTPTEPLSSAQKTAIRTILDGVHARATRALNMKQQEMFQKSVSESYVRRPDENKDKGGLSKIFG